MHNTRNKAHSTHKTHDTPHNTTDTKHAQHTTHNIPTRPPTHTKYIHYHPQHTPSSHPRTHNTHVRAQELHKRQRSVQMRLEVLNSFACPMVLMVVACRSNRCEAPVLPRLFHTSLLDPRCMYCASEAVHLHAIRSFPQYFARGW